MVAHRFFFFCTRFGGQNIVTTKTKKNPKKKGKTRQHENHLGCLLSFIQN